MEAEPVKKRSKQKQDDLVVEAKNFFEAYKKELAGYLRDGGSIIKMSFSDLANFSPVLSEEVINYPEETLALLEVALEETGLVTKPRVRFVDLPKSAYEKIRSIRAKHLDQLLWIEGIVRQASDVRPQVVNARFECPNCGAVLSVLQIDRKFREPSRCSCGWKGNFKLLSKEMVDAQRLVIEESPDSLEGGEQPRRISVFLKEDLVDPRMEIRTTPGSRVRVHGVLKEVPVPLQTGAISTRFDIAFEANNVIPLEESYDDLSIGEEDEKQIRELAADPNAFKKLSKSLAPSIYGFDLVKQAVLLQLFGGVKKTRSDGGLTRGDIHILLVGDPGVAKSVLLKYTSRIAPKGRYVSGKAASGAGMTAAVVKDEFLKGWSLEAGAMVLSNKGVVCLHPESNVTVDNTIKPIESLFDKESFYKEKINGEEVEVSKVSREVISLLGDDLTFGVNKSSLISRKKYSGEIVKINLESGFSLKLTPEHQLVDGNTLRWSKAGDFVSGDYLLAPLKLPGNKKEIYILDILPDDWIVCLDKAHKAELKDLILSRYKNLKEFNNENGISSNYLSGGKQIKISLFRKILKDFGVYDIWKERVFKYGRSKAGESLKVCKITPDLAYFIGFSYGDGNLSIDKKHSRIHIIQSLKNLKQIDRIKEAFSNFSNGELREYIKVKKSNIRGKEVESECSTLLANSNLLTYICQFFKKDSLSNVLLFQDDCLRSFIAGCMDSDGCISIKNCVKDGKKYQVAHVEFLLTNDVRANQNFLLALRRLDCYGRLIDRKPISSIRITGREDVKTLITEIGSLSVKSKLIPELNKFISSSSSKIPMDVVSKICDRIILDYGNKTEILNKTGLSSVIYNYRNKKLMPAREQLKKIRDGISLSQDLNSEISVLLQRDFFIDKILSVEREKYQGYVYDLFIPDTHNFLCEGVIVHNCIDEIEKMDEQDRSTMHEAMEQQSVTISKANIQATLRAETTVLAAGNPKLGRFDPYTPIPQQIDISPALLSRFDVIFILRDLPNKTNDEAIASHVLEEHKGVVRDVISSDLIRKYVAYARQKVKPALSEEAVEEIKKFYIKLRSQPGKADSEIKPIPITARQLEGIVRLSEAHAKIRLSKEVTAKDAQIAIALLRESLMQVGYDEETKTFDIDKVTTGISSSKRSKIIVVKEIISMLESRLGKLIPMEELEKAVEEKISKEELEDVLNQLYKSGEVFKPRKGFIQRI